MTKASTPLLGELIDVVNRRRLRLSGILYGQRRFPTTVIHVHGSFGNFYENSLVPQMGSIYTQEGINFLSINTSSHDGIVEGGRQGELEYVGGALAKFEECVHDIDAFVAFAQRFSDRIVLQGHSLGCDRVVHYLMTTRSKYDFVLLSPCDSYQLQCVWIFPETVESQIARLKKSPPSDPLFDWVPSCEYGVKGSGNWTYPIPITRRALLSIMEGPPYHLFRVSKPAKFFLKQRAFVCIGGRDALQSWPQDVMFNYLQQRIKNLTPLYLPNSDHMIAKHERHVAKKIAIWLGLRPTK